MSYILNLMELITVLRKKYKNIFFLSINWCILKIHSINSIKLMPTLAAISGTKDSLVIPGCVFNSNK